MQDFVRALASFSPQGAAYWRARRRWSVGALGVAASLPLIAIMAAVIGLWACWQTGVWGASFLLLSIAIVPQVGIPMAAILMLRNELTQRHIYALTRRMRVAVQAGDALGASIQIAKQPISTLGASAFTRRASGTTQQFGPFTTIPSGDSGALAKIGSLLVGIGLLFCALPIILYFTILHSAPVNPNLPLAIADGGAMILVGLVLFAFSVDVLAWAHRARNSIWLEADDVGVRPRGTPVGDPDAFAWGDARAFVRVNVSSPIRHIKSTLYVLDAGDGMLTWWVAANTNGSGQQANKLLFQCVVAQTNLPLQDLTKIADTMTNWSAPSPAVVAAAPVVAEQIWMSLIPIRPRIKRATDMIVLGVLLFLGIYFAAGSWALPHAQAAIYQTLVTRIHAEQPLYHSSLATDDGGWLDRPSNGPQGQYTTSYTFQDGAYQLRGSDYVFLESLRNQVYGDVAVEVTVRMLGINTAGDGVGLLLHQGPGGYVDKHQVAFTITAKGGWSADNFLTSGTDIYSTYDQRSSAINTAPGAANTLLVLIRGHQFICFVNNIYVGSYYEAASIPGYVGLFNDDLNNVASFTNFTIYPAIESDW